MAHCRLFLLALLFPLVRCADHIGHSCDGTNDATGDEVVLANAYEVLADLTTRTYLAGFAVSAYGTGNQTVFGRASCRGEISPSACKACVSEAATNLPSACPRKSDATIWYDDCWIRYSTDEFIGSYDTTFDLILWNDNNASQPELFDSAVMGMMTALVSVATTHGNRRFAAVNVDFHGYPTIYALTQCSLDLSLETCNKCLWSASNMYDTYCKFHLGCRIQSSSCMWRYELYDFLSQSSESQNDGGNKKLKRHG